MNGPYLFSKNYQPAIEKSTWVNDSRLLAAKEKDGERVFRRPTDLAHL